MKVRFLASDPALGPDIPYGDSIRVRLLLDALAQGHDVDVHWAGPAPAPSGGGQTAHLRRAPDGVLQLARDGRALARAAEFARRARRGAPADVVFEFASYLAPVGRALTRGGRMGYVVEVEGPLAQLRYEHARSPLRALGDALERDRLRAADAVVAVSEPLADFLVGLGAHADRVHVVPNAVDLSRFSPDGARRVEVRSRLEFGDGVVVGFQGVFSPWYRLDALVEAIAGLENVALLLVGDGVDRPKVEAAVERLGARDQVTITGFVAHNEVPAYVDAFDIGVVSDHVWWTSPLKLFEYGAMRKAVVAARAPSVTSVASGSDVRLVERDELRAAIRELAADAEQRHRLADAWHARVAADYSLTSLRERLDAILRRVAP